VAPPRALIQYYKDCIVDKRGDAKFLAKANIISVAPIYDRAVITVMGEEVVEPEATQNKSSTPKTPRVQRTCWNCGSTEHQLTNCPEPRNRAVIETNRREFLSTSQSTPNSDTRYYVDELETSIDKKLLKDFKPGVLSQNLRDALGMGPNEVPPFYAAMRFHGPPPAYMASGLTMDDPSASKKNEPTQLVEYPGLSLQPQQSIISNGTTKTPLRNSTGSAPSTPQTPNQFSTPTYMPQGIRNSTNTFSPSPVYPRSLTPNALLQSPSPYFIGNYPTQPQYQQYQHIPASPYKPPDNTQSNLRLSDMDVT